MAEAIESSRSEKGQATVELILMLPMIVMLALLVLQVGLVAKDQLLVQHAAREAARAAAVHPTLEAASTSLAENSSLRSDRSVVLLSGALVRGSQVTATVSYRSPTEVPIVGRLVKDVPLESSVTMRVE